jgi:hypothetical protein
MTRQQMQALCPSGATSFWHDVGAPCVHMHVPALHIVTHTWLLVLMGDLSSCPPYTHATTGRWASTGSASSLPHHACNTRCLLVHGCHEMQCGSFPEILLCITSLSA